MAQSNFSIDKLKGKLVSPDGKKLDSDALNGKRVMIYFSAHWCPPCRSFTPSLVEFHKKHHESKNFEIVFVSCDRDEKSFKDYHGTMSFPALDFTEKDTLKEVQSDFNVSGIPALILLNEDGSVALDNARSNVTSKPDDFPWGK